MTTKLTASVAAAFSLAALASASPALAASPKITSGSASEGTAVAVSVSHKCGAKKCYYGVEVKDATATAPTDYTPVTATTGKARKGKTFRSSLSIQTVEDQACEPNETATVHVTLVRKGQPTTFDASATIVDDDCADTTPTTTPTTTSPAPADGEPAFPMSESGLPEDAKIETKRTYNGISRTCTSPLEEGRQQAGAGPGWYLAPCYVHLYCPTTVKACQGTVGNTINAPQDPHGYVHNYATGHVLDGKGGDTYLLAFCQAFGKCSSSKSAYYVKPGEWLMNECTGYHDPNYRDDGWIDRTPITPSNLTCTAELAFTL